MNIIREIYYFLQNIYYEINFKIFRKLKKIKVKNKKETMKELLENKKSIARFGDGEFELILGKSIDFQIQNELLKEKLRKILISKTDKVIVAIPNVFSNLNIMKLESKIYWRKYIHLNKLNDNLDIKKEYYDSLITRPYMDLKNKDDAIFIFESFKKIWDKKKVLIIEGEGTRIGVNNNLLKNAEEIKRIIAPSKNAFEKYDDIFKEVLKFSKETLILIALGPTATVLAFELGELGYQSIDIGHLDIEYEWFLLKAEKKVAIKNKYTNEVKEGKIVTKLSDCKYLKEIIKKIN